MRAGDRVAMLALNSDRYLEYQMAVPWGGGVMNPCNVRWSPVEILYSLQDSGSTLLLVDDALLPVFERFRVDAECLRHVIYCGEGPPPDGTLDYETLLRSAEPVPDAVRRGDDLAGIFYTGGTTGKSKGVMLSHTNLGTSALALHGEALATPGGTYLHAAPMFHLADFGFSNLHWIAGSAHSVIRAFEPGAILRTIRQDQVTDVLLVPTMIQALVDHMEQQSAPAPGSLRRIVFGASPISESLLTRAMAVLPSVDFVQAYGMTELAPLATINPAFYHRAENRGLGKLRAAGRASFCTEVRIVDPQDNEVPRGTVGEVVVRGPNVMLGYWNKPDATATAIRGGWMHTGDGAHMDGDGFIYIVDRMKDMIISGGENVYSAEVENVMAQHPAVAACAVIGIPSEQWGETVHAVVVLRLGAEATAGDLIAHCRQYIAHYKCPRSVAFAEALPLSGAGKVLKAELRAPFWQGQSRRVS